MSVLWTCSYSVTVFITYSYRPHTVQHRPLAAYLWPVPPGQSFEHAQNFRRVPPGVNKRQRPINVLPALITNHRVPSPFSTVRRHLAAYLWPVPTGQSFEHVQNFRRVPPGVNKRQRPINVLTYGNGQNFQQKSIWAVKTVEARSTPGMRPVRTVRRWQRNDEKIKKNCGRGQVRSKPNVLDSVFF